MKVFIFKQKKSFFRDVLVNLNTFGCLGLSFYFNYKFIGGNDFFDFIIFVIFILIFGSKLSTESKKHYYNVSEKKFEQIEKILKN